MFKKYHSSSYAIIIALVVVLLSPVIGCAQSEGNKLTSKKPSVNKFINGTSKELLSKMNFFFNETSVSK